MPARIKVLSFFAVLLVAGCGGGLRVATPDGSAAATPMGTPIDETHLVTLEGNVPALARFGLDAGAVSAATPLDRMMLVLKSSPAQQAALDALVEAQQDPESPEYHAWLTPAEFGAQFGPSEAQVAQVAGWLAGHGFTVEEISAGRRLLVFSGTAGEVASAFHTELHRYDVGGAAHMANAGDPEIPAELAGVVGGVVTLNDFRRSSEMQARSLAGAEPEYTAGATHYLFPADFATIYDLNSLYGAGLKGSGVAIAIAGRSDISLSDVANFRSMAGLTANAPSVIVDGTDPGLVSGDQSESTLDVEWSGAVAPAAAIDLVIAKSTGTTDGIDLAAEYIVDHATAPVVSVSYGSCEQEMGATELSFYNGLWEQAASEGMSVFVSSGDAGAAGCQTGSSATGTTAAVNGLCSSPYSTCVGGTELNEGGNAAEYWAGTNSAAYGSALGYIPEEVWNESGLDGGSDLWASGGGASTVYPQPAWQQGVSGSGAAGGMRAVPDVSLAAANHDGYFMVEGGGNWIVSGTSASTPTFAAIIALAAEKENGKGQGSVNARLYALAGATPDPFHTTPSGNNTVPGVGGFTADGAVYNLATGLGSVDGAVLVNGWNTSSTAGPATLTLTEAAQSATVVDGGSVSVQFTSATGGSFTGSVKMSVSGLPSGVTATWATNLFSSSASTSGNIASLKLMAAKGAAPGSSSVVVTATGDGLTATQTLTVTVTAQASDCSRFSLLPTGCRSVPRVPSF